MSGNMKLALMAALAIGAVSVEEPGRVPDKSVDFCDTVHKYHLSKYYSECSGLPTVATPGPAEPPIVSIIESLVTEKPHAPTGLPKFPYHNVKGARETAAPDALEEHRRHSVSREHRTHSRLAGSPALSRPHVEPTALVARGEDHLPHHGGPGGPDGPRGPHGPHGPHHSRPHVEPTALAARGQDHLPHHAGPGGPHGPHGPHHSRPHTEPTPSIAARDLPFSLPWAPGPRPTDAIPFPLPVPVGAPHHHAVGPAPGEDHPTHVLERNEGAGGDAEHVPPRAAPASARHELPVPTGGFPWFSVPVPGFAVPTPSFATRVRGSE